MIFLFYWTVFAILIYKSSFFKIRDLPDWFIPLIWVIKGVFAWVYCEYQNGTDTFGYFGNGRIVSDLLLTEPAHFLELVFFPSARSEVPEHLAGYISDMGYWHNSQTYFMVRVHAILNIFTFAHFHTNALVLSFLSLIGLTGIAQTVLRTYPEIDGWRMLPFFVVPTVLFWTSGGHKDAWVMFTFGLACFTYLLWLKQFSKFHWLIITLISLATLMMVRQYVIFFLVPFFVSWLWIYMNPKKYQFKMLAVWLIWLVGMSFIKIPVIGLTYLEAIKEKYYQFQALAMGNTHFDLQSFEIGMFHILSRFPESLFNVLIRPVTMISKGLLQTLAGIESLILILFIIIVLWFLDFKKQHPLVVNFFILSICLFLVIGFIVPNLGAQSRYRTFSLPIFLMFFTVFLKKR